MMSNMDSNESAVGKKIGAQDDTVAALLASEAFARTLLEASPDCLKVVGANDHVEYVNQNGACLLEIGESGDITIFTRFPNKL